jgi:hypothetical protein
MKIQNKQEQFNKTYQEILNLLDLIPLKDKEEREHIRSFLEYLEEIQGVLK